MTFLVRAVASLTLLLTAPSLLAQNGQGSSSITTRLQRIRKLYATTEATLKNCTRVEREIEGQSTEGGILTAYYLKGKDKIAVLKLEAIYYGESGKASEEFYFDTHDGSLVFVLRTDSTYTEPLSGVVKSRTEERFYFTRGELITWIDDARKSVPLPSAASREKTKELFDSVNRLLELSGQREKK
ncbi:MAG: hypothetical protein ACO1TE_27490 [Prosthecobacter sp.]